VSPRRERQPYRGQQQERFKLILAPVMATFGVVFTLCVVAQEAGWSHTVQVLAIVVPIAAMGVLTTTLLFGLLPFGWSGWLMVVALIGGDGMWIHAGLGLGVPSWIMGLFAGSILGAHARWLVERRRLGSR